MKRYHIWKRVSQNLKKTLCEGLLKWAKQVLNVPAYTTKTEV